MSLFESSAFENHEAVHAFADLASGLRTFIAIHSTARGPAAGGCRVFPYASEQAAVDDALRLSRAMSFKNAMADIPLGGGKAVIIGDPRQVKTPALFEAFGRSVEALGGRYWTAEDVGVSPADLAQARRATRFVAGLEGHPAASGDPSPVTAEGVKRGIALCVRRALGQGLDGVTVALQGVGHVGAYLAEKLAAAGAKLIVTDVDQAAVAAVVARTGARPVAPEAIFDAEAEVFAPCAMGGALTRDTIGRLKAKVVAGGANNQFGEADAGRLLQDKGILYAPDFVINGGGIINVAGEIRALQAESAFDPAWVETKLGRLMETLDEVLQRSAASGRTPHEVAVEIAEARIARA
jgi:leucine dehydrogenase